MYWKRGGGGGSGTQKFVDQKWPDQIFPILNFDSPTLVTLVWGATGGDPPPPTVYGHSNTSLFWGAV